MTYATSADRALVLSRPRDDRAAVLRVIASNHDRAIWPGGPRTMRRWVWLADLGPSEQRQVAWLEAHGFVETSRPANLIGDPVMVTATSAGLIVGRQCCAAIRVPA